MVPTEHQRLLLQRRLAESQVQGLPISLSSMRAHQQQLQMELHLRQQMIRQPFVEASLLSRRGLIMMQPTNPFLVEAHHRYGLMEMMAAGEYDRARKRQLAQMQLLAQQSPLVSNLSKPPRSLLSVSRQVTDEIDSHAPSQKTAAITVTSSTKEGDLESDDLTYVEESKQSVNSKSKKETRWLASYEELRKYRIEHGDCIVPRGYPLNPRLASWVAEQRKQYKLLKDRKQSSITAERISLLDKLDFAWNAQEAAWDRHLRDLKSFRDETGHCHVPLNHPKYPKLGLWVKEQRRHYTLLQQDKPSHMTAQRAAQLDAVGFCWDTHEATWLERLKELTAFKKEHGHCSVPTSYPKNPKLGTWVHHQRRQNRKFKEGVPCHITKERIRMLDDLEFVWFARDRSSSDSSSTSDDDDSITTDASDNPRRPSKRQRFEQR